MYFYQPCVAGNGGADEEASNITTTGHYTKEQFELYLASCNELMLKISVGDASARGVPV